MTPAGREEMPIKPGVPVRYLPAVYGIVHALVDATTVGILFGSLLVVPADLKTRFWMIFLYNLLAFGTQPVWGLAADFLNRPRAVAVTGLMLILAALPFTGFNTVVAVVLSGFGNALFHVGGGIVAFSATPGRASGPGVFVAPGALGLAVGIFLGKGGGFIPWLWGMLLLFSVAALLFIRVPDVRAVQEQRTLDTRFPIPAVLLFLLSILIRAVIGSVAGFFLEKGLITLAVLSLAAFGGKLSGGILADRFGWLKTPAVALLVSLPLLVLPFGGLPSVAVGMLLFQMTMPVTLTATAGCMPRFPGLAFGLNCLALFGGVVICMGRGEYRFYHPAVQSGLILLSVSALAVGMLLVRRRVSR